MSEENTDYNLLAELADVSHDEWDRMSPQEQNEAITSIPLMEWHPHEWELLSNSLQERILDNSIDALAGHSIEDIKQLIDLDDLPEEYRDQILLNAPENARAVNWLEDVAQSFADHYGTVDREYIISIAKEDFEEVLMDDFALLHKAQRFDEVRHLQAKFKRFGRNAFRFALREALGDSHNYPVDDWKVDRYSDTRVRELIHVGIEDQLFKRLTPRESKMRREMGDDLMRIVLESVHDPYSGMKMADYKRRQVILPPHDGPVWQVTANPDWSLVEEELLNQLGQP